jgi:hypothetical protein
MARPAANAAAAVRRRRAVTSAGEVLLGQVDHPLTEAVLHLGALLALYRALAKFREAGAGAGREVVFGRLDGLASGSPGVDGTDVHT